MQMDFTVDKLPRFSRRERDHYKLYNFEPPSTANVPTLEDLISQYRTTIERDPSKDDMKFKLDKPQRFSRLERSLELKSVNESKLIKELKLADVPQTKESVSEGALRRATYINVSVDSPPRFSRMDRESMLLIQDLPPEEPSGPVHYDNDYGATRNLKGEVILPSLDVSIVSPQKFSRQERLKHSPPFVPPEKSICQREVEFISSIYSEIPERLELGKKHKIISSKEKSTYLEGQSSEFMSFVRSRGYSPPTLRYTDPLKLSSSFNTVTSGNSRFNTSISSSQSASKSGSNNNNHVRPSTIMSGSRNRSSSNHLSKQQQQQQQQNQYIHSSSQYSSELSGYGTRNEEPSKWNRESYDKFRGNDFRLEEDAIRPSTCPT